LRRTGLEGVARARGLCNEAGLFARTILGGVRDMIRLRLAFLIFTVMGLVLYLPVNCVYGAPRVTLKVLNPRGEIAPPHVNAPSARISDPGSKKIAIYWNGKAGGDNFWNDIQALLKERLPNTKILRYSGPFDLGDDQAAAIAREADGFFYGVGD
jgi:hypothetical protein